MVLRTFGRLEVEQTDRPLIGVTARPRLLALLVVVALARERGISRDRLLAYFWPESDTQHARNCLKQILFALRRQLHDDLFQARNGFLRLNPVVITTDALEFEAAWSRGAYEDAVALYRGPFLDGFDIPRLLDLGQWIEGERVRLAQLYRAALEALANAACEAGDSAAAVEWWRELTALEPLSSRVALGFMRALVGRGDRVQALQYARVYYDLVRSELGVMPDAAVTGYAQWLREHPEAALSAQSQTAPSGERWNSSRFA